MNDGKDIDWAVLPENAKRIQFDAPSGPLAVVTLGDPNNPRVVLVAGITGSKEDFTLMMPELAAAGWFVVSYDLAGQYESAGAGPENMNPPRKHYDYKLFVDDLIAVLDSGVGPSHVLGYSFAGTVSQVAFAQRPDLFASLTFLSCPPQPGQSLRGLRRVGWMSYFPGGYLDAALLIHGIRSNITKVSESRVKFAKDRLLLTRRKSVRDIIRLMKHVPDLRPVLANSDIPILVAVGTHDLWPTSLHKTFAEQIGARFALYETGHSPCETSPRELNHDLFALYAQAD